MVARSTRRQNSPSRGHRIFEPIVVKVHTDPDTGCGTRPRNTRIGLPGHANTATSPSFNTPLKPMTPEEGHDTFFNLGIVMWYR